MYPKVFLKPQRSKNVSSGHPWIFSGGIEKKDEIEDGGLCEVWVKNDFLGTGTYNSRTDIAVRIFSREQREINEEFFLEKFEHLKNVKSLFTFDTNAYRAVFGESDGVPGLIVDKYDDILVTQLHTLGIEKLKSSWMPALQKVWSPKGIYQKLSEHSAKKEGITLTENLETGTVPEEIEIQENGLNFLVNVREGQKTGFFLDQRENRKSILPYAKNKKVINFFSYTGAFSVYAALEAQSVTSVDISAKAVEFSKKNFAVNGMKPEEYKFIAEDVFDLIRQPEISEYDFMILDPPSLARDQKQMRQAIKAYLTLNSEALKRLPHGGILATASCTSHLNEELFMKILYQSAVNAHATIRILHTGNQPFDHGYNLNFPEGRYLKFFILLKE